MKDMPRVLKKRGLKRGVPPGSLIHIGDQKTDKQKITVLTYNIESFNEQEVESVEDCFKPNTNNTVTWINVDGLHKIDTIEKIGNNFHIHPLVLEDILNTDQRPKIDEFNDYVFCVLKMIFLDTNHEIQFEQVSLLIGPTFIISFQERVGDVFDVIRDRIRTSKGRIRKMGSDYLAYSLIDAIIDNYFSILETISEKVEELEQKVITEPTPDILQQIYLLKREMIYLRKSVWPLREVINTLLRYESKIFKKTTMIYLRDLYDHTIQVIDTIETYRDMISGMLDIYMSSVSNKMNEVMKVLTIFAAIFIPLTFVAGIYGMNFHYMPELLIPWAYPVVLFGMLLIGIILLLYFKHKKWI